MKGETEMAKQKEQAGEKAFTYDTRSQRIAMLFSQSSGDYVNWEYITLGYKSYFLENKF